MIGAIKAVAALLALFAVVSAVLMRSIYWARYPYATKRRRRRLPQDWKKKGRKRK